jgi:hypothetical protein
VRDDRPFACADPPAALFHYSRDKRDEHPRTHLASWLGILQADAYGGYGELYAAGRQPGPALEAGCFAHARRKFFELADVAASARRKSRNERAGMIYPIALEAVQRLDALFDIERDLGGGREECGRAVCCSPGTERATHRRASRLADQPIRQAVTQS